MASQFPSSRPLSIVTGASSGIGRELALLAAREGFDVIAAAHTSLDEVSAELEALGVNVTAVPADLATPEGCDASRLVRPAGVEPATYRLGGGRSIH